MLDKSAAIDSITNNLPIQPTPFIGREAEVARAAEKLANPETRLLVLTGPGGTGKTRLALQVAINVIEKFKDGVFYVPLESISNADLVIGTIARQLGIQDRSKRPVSEILKNYLKERQMLLVLDSFEHVMPAASSVADLLASGTGLKILVTSREILRLQSECDFPVPSLSLPDREHEIDPEQDPVTLLLQYEAVGLFVNRAAAIQPDFEMNGDNASVVGDICRRLDGLPLAIELAVARLRLLPPREMLKRLDKSLSFLIRGAKDRPSRQQTLRGTIDWSYDLLDKRARRIFRRLSVFAGGFTLNAAEDVCRPSNDMDYDVLDDIASLEEKSLLKREASQSDSRFAMLDTVREYAEERLADSGEAEEVKRKHAEYFCAYAADVGPTVGGLNRMASLNRLERDHNNFRLALAWSFESGAEELGIDLTIALDSYWEAGHPIEALNWYDRAIRAGNTPSSAQAHALCMAGHNRCNLGDMKRGMSQIEQGLNMARGLAHAKGIAASLKLLGQWYFDSGSEKAAMYLEECIEVAKESDLTWAIPGALLQLGELAAGDGDLERAQSLFEEALVYWEEDSNVVGAAFARMNMGMIAALQGKFEPAIAILEQSLTIIRQPGNKYSIAITLLRLASIYLKQGNLARSKVLLAEAMPFFCEIAIKWGVAFGPEMVSHCLILFADIARMDGSIELAVRLLGASEKIHEPIDLAMEPWRERFDDILGAVREQLGEREFDAIWKEGQEMSLEQAVSYALDTAERAETLEKEVRAKAGKPFPDGLSNREVDVAVLLVEGLTNREIGERLFVSESTVANHVQSVLNKTGSGNRAEASAYVIRNGLTT
ncbi:MAG: tetratricopeptide repeat protein [Spirochaetales bacterium]|nr:tetratricopeptide repeat protein [Spirochaetales bacterium]